MFNLKIKKQGIKRSGSSFKEALKYALCALFVLSGAFAYIWPHIRIVKLGYEKDALRTKYEKYLQANRLMKIEVASLRSLAKIEKIATQQLKMVFPDDSKIVIVKSGLKNGKKTESLESVGKGIILHDKRTKEKT